MSLYFEFLSEGSSRPLIFLHGLAGFGGLWKPIARCFSSSFLIALDQLGHGNSQQIPSKDESLFSLAQAVIDTVKKQQWEKPVLIGHSMGARTALGAVYLNKSLFSALVMVDMPLGGFSAHFDHLQTFLTSLPDQFVSLDEAKRWLFENAFDPSIAQYLFAGLVQKKSLEFPFDKNRLIRILEQAKSVDALVLLKACAPVPTLIFRGSQSRVWTDSLYAQDKKHMEEMSFVELIELEATHGLPFEKKAVFAQRVEAFLQKNELM
jgi:pimeloyl-ACP methyl ester carboxylesterase